MSTKKDTNFVCSFEDEMKLKDTFQDLSAFKYRRFGKFLISKITLLNSCPILTNSLLNINGCQKYAFLLFSIQRV